MKFITFNTFSIRSNHSTNKTTANDGQNKLTIGDV